MSQPLRGAFPRPLPSDSATHAQTSAMKVVQAFNTWAFKREQPSDIAHLERVVAAAIDRATPVEFVLYWGKGPRSWISGAEPTCLDYLAAMGSRIAQVHPAGAEFTLIETDTHARLNGHPTASIDAYFGAIDAAASERGFKCVRLSKLTEALARSGVAVEQREPDPEVLVKLRACAIRWFRGEGSAHDGAARYFEMNMAEKRAVERAFPRAIFVTFNGSEYRSLFPDGMPIFYMYSLKRGTAVKPWFMHTEGEPEQFPATGFAPSPQA